jgi:hypothetical protein
MLVSYIDVNRTLLNIASVNMLCTTYRTVRCCFCHSEIELALPHLSPLLPSAVRPKKRTYFACINLFMYICLIYIKHSTQTHTRTNHHQSYCVQFTGRTRRVRWEGRYANKPLFWSGYKNNLLACNIGEGRFVPFFFT